MFFSPFSRRHFLKGAGASLLLPVFPSLLPKAEAQAAQAQTRYIQFISSFGQYGQNFFPSDLSGLAQQANGPFVKKLSSIAGDTSKTFNSAFTPFKNKMSLVRGMHVLAASNLHNGSLPTCSSSTPEDSEANGRPFFGYSVDAILSQSKKIYPDDTGKQALVNFCPNPNSYRNFSWTTTNGSVEHLSQTTSTASLLAKFAQQFAAGSQPQVPQKTAAEIRQIDVVNRVYGDYKGLRDGGKLSATDKARLDSYMTLIDKVQKGLNAAPPPMAQICKQPNQGDDAGDGQHINQANILAAAIACGLTRVASCGLSTSYDPIHGYSHNNNVDEHGAIQQQLGSHVAYFMGLLDALPDPSGSGTVLDNSIVYWGNEFGENAGGDPHRPDNMTAMVAGGASGLLKMGYYIDYGKAGGMPFNNFLITIMNAMGLSSSDYERNGVVGFGEYDSGSISGHKLQGATSNAASKRAALPFFYTGNSLG